MSTSDLYILNKKSTTHLAEFRNGWGSGPAAWDYLAAKYIAEKPAYSLDMSHLKKVWALASDPRLEHHEKVALMMTFDKAFVPLDKLLDAAAACKKFGRESGNSSQTNHWTAFGIALEEIAEQKHSRHARGVVLSCTSVSDMWIEPSSDYLENAWSIYADAALAQKASEVGKVWTKEDVEGAAQDLQDEIDAFENRQVVDTHVLTKKLKHARAALLDYSNILD